MTKKALFLCLLLAPGLARALTCVSQASGNWSSPATWSGCGGGVPGQTDTVTVSHLVTVDGITARASTTTINGTLKFSRVSTATLTLANGNMTVNPSGLLDMGTLADPIVNVRATLVLARGNGALRYGLTIQDGGNFTSYGASKWTVLTSTQDAPEFATSLNVPAAQSVGWAAGDTLLLGPTEDGIEVETRTISGISGSDPKTVTWSGALAHNHYYPGKEFRVANLSRNVVVRSSGTNVTAAGNSSYIMSYSRSSPGFAAVLTEFAYLGTDQVNLGMGMTFINGASASLSRCAVHDGMVGVSLLSPTGGVVEDSVFYNNDNYAIDLGDPVDSRVSGNDVFLTSNNGGGVALFSNLSTPGGNVVRSNHLYSVSGNQFLYTMAGGGGDLIEGNDIRFNYIGLEVTAGQRMVLSGNLIRENRSDGMVLTGGTGHLLSGNISRDNVGTGLSLVGGSGHLLGGDRFFGNGGEGIYVQADGSVFAGEGAYSNDGPGLYIDGADAELANVVLGYNNAGGPAANTGAEISLNPAGSGQRLVLRNSRLNPATGIATAGFNKAGNSLISYGQDPETGTVRIHGDYVPSAAMTLDRAQRLLPARVTPDVLMRGNGHDVTSVVPVAAAAVSQVVSVRFDGTNWRVEGSSSGFMGNYVVGGGAQSFPTSGTAQFTMAFSPGFSTAAEDRVAFAVLAATQDLNVRKGLLFGDSAAAFNGGRSKLTAGPGVALTLRGTAAEPTVVDRLLSATTYYTFVASGALTLQNVTAKNMDVQGFQLSGSGGVTISSVAFDDIGGTGGAYLTLRTLTSSLALYNMAFDDSPGRTPWSVNVQGTNPNLSWAMATFSGVRSGNAFDNDPNGRIYWSGSTPVGAPTAFTALAAADGIGLAWTAPSVPPAFFRGAYALASSSVSAAGPFAPESAPAAGATAQSDPGLLPQTTYHYQLQASDLNGFLSSASTAAAMTGDFALPAVLSLQPLSGRTTGVPWGDSLTVTFNKAMPLPSVQGATTLRRLKDHLAQDVDEGWMVTVSPGGTANEFVAAATAPLAGNSLYELRVSTAATDPLGQPLASSATLSFMTLMDRTERNVVTGTWNGAVLDIPPFALPLDGYLEAGAAPAQAAAATQKLLARTGDAYRQAVGSGPASLALYDDFGAPQAGFSAPVTVSLPFTDNGGDGIVDGTTARVRTLSLYWLDETDGVWVRLPSSVGGGLVTARVPQAAAFALFASADAELSEGFAYPVPFVPGGTKTTITFASVGQGSVIRIYTPAGGLVRELVSDALSRADWDLRTADGSPAAPGVYLYRITNGGAVKTGKLAVLR